MTRCIAWMGWQECAIIFVAAAVLTGLLVTLASIVVMVCRRGKR